MLAQGAPAASRIFSHSRGSFFAKRLFDDGAQRRLVFLPREPVGEARVFQRVGAAERRHQRAVLLLLLTASSR